MDDSGPLPFDGTGKVDRGPDGGKDGFMAEREDRFRESSVVREVSRRGVQDSHLCAQDAPGQRFALRKVHQGPKPDHRLDFVGRNGSGRGGSQYVDQLA